MTKADGNLGSPHSARPPAGVLDAVPDRIAPDYPAFAEPARRLAALLDAAPAPGAMVVTVIEGDVALTLAALRAANAEPGAWAGEVDTVVRAVELLGADGLRRVAGDLATTDYFRVDGPYGELPHRMRRHAAATARAADRLAVRAGLAERDRLVAAAVLHDIGVVVLADREPAFVPWEGTDPRKRCARERAACGIDHAQAGAAALAAAGLPATLTSAVAAHHRRSATGLAAYVRLADLLAHEALGDTPPPLAVQEAARALGLGVQDVREVVFELPDTGTLPERSIDPCPLSLRERQVLSALSAGRVYKQIAHDLQLSTSTVRTHLHNIYGKLGAVDRAQAVLIAQERGWL